MTQKYEPVEWEDETPTQPGTLINKARLDQMQSAHHFADGFEEVDAVPTEDPGTDYHKVVYCTADSTFYRWDGTEWTADIDDDTKRLLEEHEADHANPHEVTKAQVGLGNVDNTSDADKPVSTATAAALAGKVDKLGSSPAGSYTKVTVNAQGQVTAGSNPATLAEAGITDAYTKSEINTKLGDGSVTKVGTADVGSDTLPIKLVGGSPTPVADALAKDSTVVHLAGAETIPGTKTFSSIIYHEQSGNQYDLVGIRSDIDITALTGTAYKNILKEQDKNGVVFASISSRVYTDQSSKAFLMTLSAGNVGQTSEIATVAILDAYPTMVRTVNAQTIAGNKTFTGQMLATGQRAYNTANETDVVTIGSLKASTDVVHRTGAETIAGAKTHTSEIIYSGNGANPFIIKNTNLPADRTNYNAGTMETNFAIQNSNNQSIAIFGIDDTPTYRMAKLNVYLPGGTGWKGIRLRGDSSGAYVTAPNRAYAAANTDDVATIGTLDAYTPMVRTTGAQDITGQKSFENNVYQGINIGTGTAGWRCVAKLPASTSGTSAIIMVAGHGSAIFNLLHYQCRNHNPRLVSIATTGDYNGKLAAASDGTDEYLYINSTSNHEFYPLGGNKTVPLRLVDLPTTQYATDADLTAAYTTVVII